MQQKEGRHRPRDGAADCGNDDETDVGKIARKINDFYSLNCI